MPTAALAYTVTASRRSCQPLPLRPGLPTAVYGPFGGAQMTVKQVKDDANPPPATESAEKRGQENEEKDEAAQAPAQQPAAEQPASTGAAACSLQLAAGAAPQAFAGCRRITLGQTQMHLLWSAAPVAGNPAVRACCCCGA